MFSGCGLFGVMLFGDKVKSFPNITNTQKMLDSLKHRGPNGSGLFNAGNIVLGHRRLSILDLSASGNQPMEREHLTIITNGEVYNYKEIKKELKEYQFTTNTDTEVILRCYQKYGSKCLEYFNGMFAIAIWDKNTQELFIARDRMGKKPLYYYRNDKILIFASEVNTILQSGIVPKHVNMDYMTNIILLSSLFHLNNNTAIKSINSLPMGHYAKIKLNGSIDIKKYWDLPTTKYPLNDERELIDKLDELLNKSIRLRLISDTPVSAFLSGGIDSSLINIIACKQLDRKLLSLTTNYKQKNNRGISKNNFYYNPEKKDDLHYSKMLAQSLKKYINHKIVYYTPSGVTTDEIDNMVDLSSIADDIRFLAVNNNYSFVKKNRYKVVLNGQGPDEIMAGYIGLPNFYEKIFDAQKPDSTPLLTSLPSFGLIDLKNLNKDIFTKRNEIYAEAVSFYNQLPGNSIEKVHRFLIYTQLKRILQFEDFYSMKNSIECRLPFLDHNIVEFSFMVDYNNHITAKDRIGKVLLRKLATRYLPQTLCERGKQPFPYLPDNLIYDSLLKIFKDNNHEILNCDILKALINMDNYKKNGNFLSQKELWSIINIWRFGASLKAL